MREALERIVAIVDKRIRPRRWLGELEVMGEIAREALASEPESVEPNDPTEPSKSFGVQHLEHPREEPCESSSFPAPQADDSGSSIQRAEGTNASAHAGRASTPPGDQPLPTSEPNSGEKPGASGSPSTSRNSEASEASRRLATHTKPVVWCRCGDGIEDPKCKTCYLTDREPSAVEALLYDAFESGWFDNHGSIADAWAERGPDIRARLTRSTEPTTDAAPTE